MRKLQLAIMAAALSSALSASAVISPLVTSPGGDDYYNSPPPGTEGFTFTTGVNPLTYNALGVYDCGNDGLAASHVVTLFDTAGDTLASATIASGGSATADSFQWANIAAVTLSANTTYVLAASYGADDPDHFYYGSAVLPLGVTLGDAVWASGGTSAFPDQVFGSGGFFGPNMGVAVPEPTTILAGALLLLPFGASTIRILRKKIAA
jgi:hypothetical protein